MILSWKNSVMYFGDACILSYQLQNFSMQKRRTLLFSQEKSK